jgi:hypothetical protein
MLLSKPATPGMENRKAIVCRGTWHGAPKNQILFWFRYTRNRYMLMKTGYELEELHLSR